jgi:low temperature requirement protein LtrA
LNANFLKYFLVIGIVTDLLLIVYLSTMIEEIGIMFFILLVIMLLGGTLFLYTIIKKNNRGS